MYVTFFFVQTKKLHIINKDYEAAIQDLEKAIELEPEFACAIGQKLYIEYQKLMMINDFINKNRVIKGKVYLDAVVYITQFNYVIMFVFRFWSGRFKVLQFKWIVALVFSGNSFLTKSVVVHFGPILMLFCFVLYKILLSNNETKKAESFIVRALENDPADPTLYNISLKLVKLKN